MGISLPEFRLVWKTAGIGLALVVVILNLMLAFDLDPYIGIIQIVFIALNLLASISWLYGIITNKPSFMMASIFWWSVPVTLWIYFMIRFMQRLVNDLIDGTDNEISFAKNVIGLSVFVVAFYFIAVMSYKSSKKAASEHIEMQQLNVSYSNINTQIENADSVFKYTNVSFV